MGLEAVLIDGVNYQPMPTGTVSRRQVPPEHTAAPFDETNERHAATLDTLAAEFGPAVTIVDITGDDVTFIAEEITWVGEIQGNDDGTVNVVDVREPDPIAEEGGDTTASTATLDAPPDDARFQLLEDRINSVEAMLASEIASKIEAEDLTAQEPSDQVEDEASAEA